MFKIILYLVTIVALGVYHSTVHGVSSISIDNQKISTTHLEALQNQEEGRKKVPELISADDDIVKTCNSYKSCPTIQQCNDCFNRLTYCIPVCSNRNCGKCIG
ncbi:hypothetical protein BY996DRAFT_7017124 [Phakopsora pachyrhizi]|nr:hypothetical protein BY996DRAFT_7017124 [Phakopsora pachyrhizi]